MQNKMTADELFEVARSGKQFHVYHSPEATAAIEEATLWQATFIRAAYQFSYNGPIALKAALFGTAAFYLGAFVFAPTLFPFGIAAISAYYTSYIVAIAAACVAYQTMGIFKDIWKNLQSLASRLEHKQLTSHDVAALVITALFCAGLATTMYAWPAALLPVLGSLGSVAKPLTATALAIGSLVSGAAAFFGRPGPAASASRREREKERELELDESSADKRQKLGGSY